MIKSVHDYQIDDVFKKDAQFYYVIPKYQREYRKRSKIKCTSGHKPPKGYSIPRELPV